MEPSLLEGDHIMVNKWAYGLRTPLAGYFGYHRWQEKPVEKNDIIVFNNPVNNNPSIDDREVFISRCIALPGDTLLVDSAFSPFPKEKNHLLQSEYPFHYPIEKREILDSLLRTIDNRIDTNVVNIDSATQARNLSWATFHQLELMQKDSAWLQPSDSLMPRKVFALIIPRKGQKMDIQPWNRTLLTNTILLHEHKNISLKGDSIWIDEQPASHYSYTKDYHWVSSYNPINMTDSRLFGFVPHDHIIGKPSYIWFSKEHRSSLFDGYRWNRFFNKVQP